MKANLKLIHIFFLVLAIAFATMFSSCSQGKYYGISKKGAKMKVKKFRSMVRM